MTIASILASVTITIIPFGSAIPGTLYHCGDNSFLQGSVTGLYTQNGIFICGEEREKTKYHELGHHFWYKFLTDAQRSQYKALYEAHKGDKKNFYSAYAMTNVEEDFAENFYMVSQNKKGKGKLRERVKLIIAFLGK